MQLETTKTQKKNNAKKKKMKSFFSFALCFGVKLEDDEILAGKRIVTRTQSSRSSLSPPPLQERESSLKKNGSVKILSAIVKVMRKRKMRERSKSMSSEGSSSNCTSSGCSSCSSVGGNGDALLCKLCSVVALSSSPSEKESCMVSSASGKCDRRDNYGVGLTLLIVSLLFLVVCGKPGAVICTTTACLSFGRRRKVVGRSDGIL